MSRRVLALAVAAALGLLAIWYLVLWSPQTATLDHARTAVATAVQKEHALKAQVGALQVERTHLPAKQAELAQLSQAIPRTPDVDKLIDDINAAALASGVSVETFSPTAPSVSAPVAGTATTGTVSLNVTMSVQGNYFQLIDYVNKFNSMPRLAVVDGINLSTPDKDGKMTAAITGHVFTVAPAAPTKTPTTTAKVAS